MFNEVGSSAPVCGCYSRVMVEALSTHLGFFCRIDKTSHVVVYTAEARGEYPPDSRVFKSCSEIRHVDQVSQRLLHLRSSTQSWGLPHSSIGSPLPPRQQPLLPAQGLTGQSPSVLPFRQEALPFHGDYGGGSNGPAHSPGNSCKPIPLINSCPLSL